MPNLKDETILPLLKSLEEDLSRLTEKQKMVETEMAQLFSKLKDRFLDLSEDLAALKQLIEQLNYGNSFIVDALREGSHE